MLILVRGVPGSGKSTLVRNRFPNILHLENDMLHYKDGAYDWKSERMKEAIDWCFAMTRIALRHGMDVVVSNTLTKRKYIQAYVDLADDYGVPHKVIRCENRFNSIHDVPEEVMKSMKDGFEDWDGEEIVVAKDAVS